MSPMSLALRGPIGDLQLSENVRNVILYCALGEEECAGDLSIAGPFRNKAKYLEFTFGEWLDTMPSIT